MEKGCDVQQVVIVGPVIFPPLTIGDQSGLCSNVTEFGKWGVRCDQSEMAEQMAALTFQKQDQNTMSELNGFSFFAPRHCCFQRNSVQCVWFGCEYSYF